MEPRQLLAANPIQLGVVYTEFADDNDASPDRFEIRFTGGVAGTQLTHMVIDTSTSDDGVFFDTAAGGQGKNGYAPAQLVETSGLTILTTTTNSDGSVTYTCSGYVSQVTISVVDGGTSLTIDAIGLEAGETLTISIDVDEWDKSGSNAVAEAGELEYSTLTATFTLDNYYDATGTSVFLDEKDSVTGVYDNTKAAAIGLPLDGSTAKTNLMAAGFLDLTQQKMPISIKGTVFEDTNGDNDQDTGELGISGVTVTLLKWNDATSRYEFYASKNTDSNGDYSFTDLDAGKYQVSEGTATYSVNGTAHEYLDVGAAAGVVGTVTHGSVVNKNLLTGIVLVGGDECVENNFAEAKPAALSGHVYVDADNDGVFDTTETGIQGVTITVTGTTNTGESVTRTVTTLDNGSWAVDNLLPGTYTIVESQPANYLDGRDRKAGAAADSATSDKYSSVTLVSYQTDSGYDFGERLVMLSGHVYVDTDNDGIFDTTEAGLEGVHILVTGTAADGSTITREAYTSTGGKWVVADLPVGTYKVTEDNDPAKSPILASYIDGKDTKGSVGGTVANDVISTVVLNGTTLVGTIEATDYNFGERIPAKISGYVFKDGATIYYSEDDAQPDTAALRDGTRTSDDTPLARVKVTLGDASGVALTWTYTDANGYYEFTMLEPGIYTL